MSPHEKHRDGASLKAAIRERILAIDRLRDAQALKRAAVHRRMRELHDLALALREEGGSVRVPMPPIAPDPAGKWSWNGEDFINLWLIASQAAGRPVELSGGYTLEQFRVHVAEMDAACDRIRREIEDARALADEIDRLEARRQGVRPPEDPAPLPFKLSCRWDDGLKLIVISWAKAEGIAAARFDVCQSAADPYDPKIERIVGVDFASPGRIEPEFGPGVTMRFRVYGRAPDGRLLRSNVVSVTRPL